MAPHPVTWLLAAMLVSGCAHAPSFLRPPVSEWRSTLEDARAAADSGKWATADRRLAEYEARYPGSAEARETHYWRGLFRLAPGNDSTALRTAVPALERYLAQPGGTFRTEARLLIDLANAQQALRRDAAAKEREIAQIRTALGRAQATTGAPASATEAAPDRGLAAEVERLKGELARANQELERIRRRLAGERPR